MNLISRLTSLFRRRPAASPTTADVPPPPRPSAQAHMFTVESDRRSAIQEARRMYAGDPRADAVLHAVARDVARGGFTVVIPQQPNAQRARDVSQQLIDRLNLTASVAEMTRETLRDGDGFYELAVDADNLIQSVERHPTLEMTRLSNLEDRFPDPSRAFAWSDIIYAAIGMVPREAIFFAEWQIVHARWDRDSESRYGRPLLDSGRLPWRYASEGEKDIAVRRKTRAGMRYVHSLEDADEGDIRAYEERNKQALSDPNVAIADFFSNKKTTIDAVQGDAHLAEIADVAHHITTTFFNSPIPLFLLGYGENLNRDVLEQQQAQYTRALEGIAAWLDDQLIIPLIERQWLLAGIWPASIRYEIRRPSRTPLSAKLLSDAAAAATAMRTAGLPDEIVYELLAQIVPGLDVARILELRAAMQQAQPSPDIGGQGTQPSERRNGHAANPLQETVIYAQG